MARGRSPLKTGFSRYYDPQQVRVLHPLEGWVPINSDLSGEPVVASSGGTGTINFVGNEEQLSGAPLAAHSAITGTLGNIAPSEIIFLPAVPIFRGFSHYTKWPAAAFLQTDKSWFTGSEIAFSGLPLNSVSSFAGELSLSPAAAAGTIDAVSGGAGQPAVDMTLSGAMSATSVLIDNGDPEILIGEAVASHSTISGDLQWDSQLSAGDESISTLSGNLDIIVPLATVMPSLSAGTASLDRQHALAAVVASTTTFSGDVSIEHTGVSELLEGDLVSHSSIATAELSGTNIVDPSFLYASGLEVVPELDSSKVQVLKPMKITKVDII